MINNISIRNYRMFKELDIERFGKVNLIVGKNNVGKSSLLEALWLFYNEGSLKVLEYILSIRGGFDGFRPNDNLYPFFKELFYNSNDLQAYSIKLEEGEKVLELSLDTTNGSLNISHLNPEKHTRILFSNERIPFLGIDEKKRNNLVVTKKVEIDKLSQLWSKIALTSEQKFIIQSLKIIEPRIKALTFIDAENSKEKRKAVVVFEDSSERIALSRMGDGINHILAIILNMLTCKDGIVLIDEFESGLHWSVQKQLWDIIFLLSQGLNIQVFATTHSKDCIEAFQKACISSKQEENALLLKLIERNNSLKSKSFSIEEIRLATEEDIEIR